MSTSRVVCDFRFRQNTYDQYRIERVEIVCLQLNLEPSGPSATLLAT